MKFFLQTRGETIIEVLIALSIFTIIAGPAAALLLDSRRSTENNRLSLIAENLASSGVEMMRNFRDSNRIKYSAEGKKCAFTKPNLEQGGCDEAGNLLGDGHYILTINPVTKVEDLLQPNGGLSANLAGVDDAQYLLYLNDASHVYTHTADGGKPTGMYREIELITEDLDPAVQGPEAVIALVRVVYRAGSKIKTVQRAISLSSFL